MVVDDSTPYSEGGFPNYGETSQPNFFPFIVPGTSTVDIIKEIEWVPKISETWTSLNPAHGAQRYFRPEEECKMFHLCLLASNKFSIILCFIS